MNDPAVVRATVETTMAGPCDAVARVVIEPVPESAEIEAHFGRLMLDRLYEDWSISRRPAIGIRIDGSGGYPTRELPVGCHAIVVIAAPGTEVGLSLIQGRDTRIPYRQFGDSINEWFYDLSHATFHVSEFCIDEPRSFRLQGRMGGVAESGYVPRPPGMTLMIPSIGQPLSDGE